jgi:tRNA (guanine37-N1)-methyltransferase
MLKIGVITIFPQLIEPYLSCGIITRALDLGLEIKTFDLRAYSPYPHGQVDDRPFGGGPGMVLMPDVLLAGLKAAHNEIPNARVIILSPVGRLVKQQLIQETLNFNQNLIFICGRYEGFDQRFIEQYVNDSWCIGDYILSGGELGALVCIDALARLIPGVVNEPQSIVAESFSSNLLDYPHYTRPRVFEDLSVPDVLLSGHHGQIQQWREQQSLLLTKKWRPDLLDEK